MLLRSPLSQACRSRSHAHPVPLCVCWPPPTLGSCAVGYGSSSSQVFAPRSLPWRSHRWPPTGRSPTAIGTSEHSRETSTGRSSVRSPCTVVNRIERSFTAARLTAAHVTAASCRVVACLRSGFERPGPVRKTRVAYHSSAGAYLHRSQSPCTVHQKSPLEYFRGEVLCRALIVSVLSGSVCPHCRWRDLALPGGQEGARRKGCAPTLPPRRTCRHLRALCVTLIITLLHSLPPQRGSCTRLRR